MITIGIGNWKGGVGSTTLAWNLAALIQSSGRSVAIADTIPLGLGLQWCVRRSEREGRTLNTSLASIGYFHVDDYSDLRLAGDRYGYDYLLLDCCNARPDLAQALRYVQHWLSPLRPTEFRQTLMLYQEWIGQQRRGSVVARSFSAVVNLTPSAESIEDDPEWKKPMYHGEYAAEFLATEAPEMAMLKRQIQYNEALANTFDEDVFAQHGPEAIAARDDIRTIWLEMLQNWQLQPPAAEQQADGDPLLSLHRFKRYMIDRAPA